MADYEQGIIDAIRETRRNPMVPSLQQRQMDIANRVNVQPAIDKANTLGRGALGVAALPVNASLDFVGKQGNTLNKYFGGDADFWDTGRTDKTINFMKTGRYSPTGDMLPTYFGKQPLPKPYVNPNPTRTVPPVKPPVDEAGASSNIAPKNVAPIYTGIEYKEPDAGPRITQGGSYEGALPDRFLEDYEAPSGGGYATNGDKSLFMRGDMTAKEKAWTANALKEREERYANPQAQNVPALDMSPGSQGAWERQQQMKADMDTMMEGVNPMSRNLFKNRAKAIDTLAGANYHNTMADVARTKLPTDIDLASSTAALHRTTAGVQALEAPYTNFSKYAQGTHALASVDPNNPLTASEISLKNATAGHYKGLNGIERSRVMEKRMRGSQNTSTGEEEKSKLLINAMSKKDAAINPEDKFKWDMTINDINSKPPDVYSKKHSSALGIPTE